MHREPVPRQNRRRAGLLVGLGLILILAALLFALMWLRAPELEFRVLPNDPAVFRVEPAEMNDRCPLVASKLDQAIKDGAAWIKFPRDAHASYACVITLAEDRGFRDFRGEPVGGRVGWKGHTVAVGIEVR